MCDVFTFGWVMMRLTFMTCSSGSVFLRSNSPTTAVHELSLRLLIIKVIIISTSKTLEKQEGHFVFLPSKAVCSSDDPRAVHQHTSTHQSPVQPQVYQPRPTARWGTRPSHDTRARLCQILHDGQTLTTHSCMKAKCESS